MAPCSYDNCDIQAALVIVSSVSHPPCPPPPTPLPHPSPPPSPPARNGRCDAQSLRVQEEITKYMVGGAFCTTRLLCHTVTALEGVGGLGWGSWPPGAVPRVN